MERLNRIETIISTGRSSKKYEDENVPPQIEPNDYLQKFKQDLSPIYSKRAAISPVPAPKLE